LLKYLGVLKKFIAIMQFLAKKETPAGVTEIATELNIAKSYSHKLLSQLCEYNVVLHTDQNLYTIGPTVLLWGGAFHHTSALVSIAGPILMKLRDESGETVHLSTYRHGHTQYITKYDSLQTVILRYSHIGSELPLYCTAAGRAILAALPSGELEDYFNKTIFVKRTANTAVNPHVILEKISLCRKLGFAEENQENEENIRCIGAAIVDRRNYPIAAISITAPSFRFSDDDVYRYGIIISETAKKISSELFKLNIQI